MDFRTVRYRLGGELTEGEHKAANKVYSIMAIETKRLEAKVHEMESRLISIGFALNQIKTNSESIRSNDEKIKAYETATGRR